MRDYRELCRTLIKVALKAMRALFIWLFCLCKFTAARGSQLHIHLSIHRYYIIQSRFIFRIIFARMFCVNEQEYPFAVELNEWAIYESILTLHIHQFITNQFFFMVDNWKYHSTEANELPKKKHFHSRIWFIHRSNNLSFFLEHLKMNISNLIDLTTNLYLWIV